jgi:hypothetical protein
MATWPTTGAFPQFPLIGTWNRQRQQNTIVFEPDVGPPLVRRRSTVSTQQASFALTLTLGQLATLETFFVTDCNEGATPFTFDNPETGTSEQWAWVQPPVVSQSTKNAYTVQCSLRRDY